MENKEQQFKIRAYTKAELAMLYCPGECVSVAMRTLWRWMRMNKGLMAELEGAGYNKFRRGFTPREVEVLVRWLGEP